ncbi:MAG: hypothetical protein ACKVP3_18875 [Hyphomicrobiaceae bacterium]
MKKLLFVVAVSALCLGPAIAQEARPAADELAAFRSAYTSGKGLTYVVVKDEKGETVYRYGDASREAAKRDKRGFMLFTCALPRPFVAQDAKAMESLKTARVVQAGEPEFAELDRRYISGCRNPWVRSALPKR